MVQFLGCNYSPSFSPGDRGEVLFTEAGGSVVCAGVGAVKFGCRARDGMTVVGAVKFGVKRGGGMLGNCSTPPCGTPTCNGADCVGLTMTELVIGGKLLADGAKLVGGIPGL